MQYRLRDSIGLIDAKKCNDAGAALELGKPATFKKGEVVDLTDAAAAYLRKKYPAIIEPVTKVKGEAKQSEIAAPSK
jgi:hypothetical protein